MTIVSTWELLPAFFAQSSGGTPIRQLVVTIAVLLFFISGGGFLWRWRKQNSDVLYWYALGLMLMALGMTGLWLQTAMGTPLNWVGRGSLMLGALYLLAAVLVSIREARLRQVPAPEALAMLFGQQANLKLLFDSIGDAIVATDAGLRITGWNRAAEKIYGWKTSEVAGKYLWEVLNIRNPDGTPFVSGENIPVEGIPDREMIHTRRDGEDLSVLATVNTFRDRKGRLGGTVSIFHDNTERKQAEAELQLHRKNLEDLVNERTRELRRLSHRLVDAQEKERTTIGNELHDEIGQYLTYATLLISRAVRDPQPELLTQAKSAVQEAIAKIRVLSSLLSPRLLNSAGLQMALSSLTEDYTRHTEMKVDFSHSDQLEDVNEEAALAIYRITQESLTNVARHAKASEVKVTVSRQPGSVRLEVIDNGEGFDVKDKTHTTGLTGMRERALALGGTLVIDSSAGHGTSIRVEIPVQADSKQPAG
jgi:PAS domain S-box-containing protein